MALNFVTNPYAYYNARNKGKPVFNGFIYVGEPDLDPTIVANQKTLTAKQEDGTQVPIANPVSTNSGGYPVDDSGNPVVILVDGNYAIRVDDAQGNLALEQANVNDGVPITLTSTEVVFNYNNLNDAVISTSLVDGQALNIKERIAGNGGGGLWDVVLSSTVTENTFNIVQCTGVSTLSMVLRQEQYFNTIEQLGYDGTNAGSVCNAARADGINVKLNNSDYVVDETILIDTNFHLIGLNEKDSRLVAVSTLTGNIIDTLNFDALVSGNIVDTTPVSGLACPYGMRLQNFSVLGNFDTYPGGATNVTQGNGMGIRVYGKQFYLDRLTIAETANCGLYTELSLGGSFTSPFLFLDNNKQGAITNVSVYQNGKEGFIFNGPTDIFIDQVRCGVNANSKNIQGVAQTSVEITEASYGVHGISILRSAHFGFINGFNNSNGRGINLQRVTGDPGLRIDAGYIQVDGCWGGLNIDENTRVQCARIEGHANTEGDGTEPHIRDGSAFGTICPDVRIYREGDELGSTGVVLDSTCRNSNLGITFNNDTTATGFGHGVDLDGAGWDVDVNVSDQTGTAQDATDATGIIVRSGADKYRLIANSRLNEANINFEGAASADLDSELRVRARDGVTSGIVNVERFNSFQLRQIDILNDQGGTVRRNKDTQTTTVDASATGLQTVVVNHNYIKQPLERDIQLTLSYNSGTSPDEVRGPYVVGTTTTDVTIQYEFLGGAAGSMSINMYIG